MSNRYYHQTRQPEFRCLCMHTTIPAAQGQPELRCLHMSNSRLCMHATTMQARDSLNLGVFAGALLPVSQVRYYLQATDSLKFRCPRRHTTICRPGTDRFYVSLQTHQFLKAGYSPNLGVCAGPLLPAGHRQSEFRCLHMRIPTCRQGTARIQVSAHAHCYLRATDSQNLGVCACDLLPALSLQILMARTKVSARAHYYRPNSGVCACAPLPALSFKILTLP